MNKSDKLVYQLFSIRNHYGKINSNQKLNLLNAINREKPTTKKGLLLWYDSLLFLLGYPDNRSVYKIASEALQQLELHIQSHENLKNRLFNSGITNTNLCAAFSFEIVKWLRKKSPKNIWLDSIDANEGQIQSILSVVMPKVESEILQDANTNWRLWFKGSLKKGEELLDQLIAVFDETDLRPEIKDELWAAIGINVEINCASHLCLPPSLIKPYYHRSLIRKNFVQRASELKFRKITLNESEAEKIIECGRMILVRHLREIDPISFTELPFVSFYQLPHGLSIALTGMVPNRRHPIDSYMGYLVFKNGLPVAYAASWILFDSARIGLNVFPSYRGGESQYIFEQVLKLHSKVYHLNRFSVDPYQLGKENSDGIRSGAFWVYYHAGFRPLRKEQQQLALSESLKIRSTKGYRSPYSALTKLADSRMEMILKKNAVRLDATDLSQAYARILRDQYNDTRKPAEERLLIKLAQLLKIKNYHEEKLQFVLKNWCILLFSDQQELNRNKDLKGELKKLFELKAGALEENYISVMQQAKGLRKFIEKIVKDNMDG
ncbi:MAG: hypothetical protein ACHQF0_06480 [Chitinophagales bacterium]